MPCIKFGTSSLNKVTFEIGTFTKLIKRFMDLFYNAAVIWFIIGFLCFLLEFVLPGLILFFFAVGAWIVATLSLFIDMSLNTQLIVFLASSTLAIILFRKSVSKIL